MTSDLSDIDKGFYHLIGDVDEELFKEICLLLNVVENMPEKEFNLFLSTYGGCIYNGAAIIDRILMSPKKINIIGTGPVMSMGAIIMQHATGKRMMTKNAKMMIHQQRVYHEEGTVITAAELLNDAANSKKELEEWKKLLCEKTGSQKRTINSWLDKDTYFSAEEALKKGLIDEVVG